MKQLTQRKGRYMLELPLHLMLIPGILVTLVYSYGPMFGIIMAFQKFEPAMGFFKSKWVGWKNFEYIFRLPDFQQVIWNTFFISVMKICLGLAVPLILALLLNELIRGWFARFVQTTIFMPFFLSWAVLGGIMIELFSIKGPINSVVSAFGFEPIMFMAEKNWFVAIVVASDVWKGMGYNMIIFLAAIMGINANLYEAAEVDGAGKWRQMLHVTLPGMMPIIVLLCTLSLGSVLSAGFDQILVLYNPIVYETGDVIDTFVYRLGLFEQQYAPAAAIGLFKAGISVVLVSISYYLAYRLSNYRIF
ncbi:protein lplB [Paenibacillus agaridevorans]|uniref:Protein lplB n=1 Tax=Paenibacillus agaridevorans TaxID=171404 RepID=A0A2R5F0E0_9BACL|nr:ABC transporter permease subunit [Paenibacillus agaridevorans]GBG09543.1 protein lplB [Paenibacillus agaridevorans]